VEDNLAALRILEDETRTEDDAIKAAQESLDVATYQYKAGVTSYLQVITAQTFVLQDKLTSVNIHARAHGRQRSAYRSSGRRVERIFPADHSTTDA
jgi:outer membrane protein TolC